VTFWVGLGIELAFLGYVGARLLDLDLDAVGWWRRLTFRGRHSRSWVRHQMAEARRREAREQAAARDALDRVWVTGIAEWAARARGQGLDRGMIGLRAS
jgi:hypothetical protein